MRKNLQKNTPHWLHALA